MLLTQGGKQTVAWGVQTVAATSSGGLGLCWPGADGSGGVLTARRSEQCASCERLYVGPDGSKGQDEKVRSGPQSLSNTW